MAALQWPGSQFNEEGSDLLEPVQILLREVNVLEKDGEVATLWATPPSVQAITAGSTMVSKAWTSLLGAAGGGGALVAALNSVSDDWKNDPRASPFIFASAITLGAVAIAIALIVRGDVAGRAAASAAQYEARARIAVAAIETIGSGRPPAPTVVTSGYVALIDNRWQVVESLSWIAGTLTVTVGGQSFQGGQILGLSALPV
ncbi:MAG: hypothetical protein IPJ15_03385 [Actinomycetales bacterium]|jgi:hypothetical protein|nr:hypothetical protein [Candidatus Phosphoribacter baldrii]MBK7610368.1 hypothetical protein [Candidatus Phosphoribacter baldrii]